MAIKFGTDGWRAIIGEEFTFENVERVAQAYTEVLSHDKTSVRQALPAVPIPLGFDRRYLSEDFAKRFASVLVANGLTVSLAQSYCPTPCISWTTKTTQAPGGIVITASHNPSPWNGVKFKESYGGSASPEFTAKIEERCGTDLNIRTVPFETAVREGKITFFNPQDAYVRQLQSLVDLKTIVSANWKIAYDPLYGAGGGYLAKVLGQPVHEIHGENDPNFGGLNPEPIDKNLGELMKLMSKGGFDVGLATDGDADRIGAVDEKGNFVTPHQIFALILEHLIDKGLRGDVVKTVSTTALIDRIAAKHGLRVHETPIGFKYICNKFLEMTPLIGGEESGGIGIPSHVYERDGLLSGLLLLEIMSVKKKRLGELLKDLVREYGDFDFVREDIHLSEADRDRVVQCLKDAAPASLAGLKVTGKNTKDGLKFFLENGAWLLLRLSGTEPLLRIYAESPNSEKTRQIIAEGRRLFR